MLIVVSIIGILASIVYSKLSFSGNYAKKTTHKSMRIKINQQIDFFYFNANSHPKEMTEAEWNDGIHSYEFYWPDGVPKTCNFGTPFEIDPSLHHIILHTDHE